jgi:RNA polymerase sigma factor (sigma-70 family)
MRNLFAQALEGSRSAQHEIDAIIRRIAKAVCRGKGPGGADVDWEDIAQEASRRFFAVGLHQFRGHGSEEGFLYAIVRSTVLQAARRAARRRDHERLGEHEEVAAAHNPGTAVDVRTILRKLPAECAWLLEQVFLQGIPYAELAAELGMLDSSVRVRVSRCLRRAMVVAGGDPQ